MKKENESINLFEKVLIISHRTKQLVMGHSPLIDSTGLKNADIAMQEFDDKKIDKSILEQDINLNQSVEEVLSQAYAEESEGKS